MYPDTRGRISTDSTGSNRPVNSSHSFTSFSTTVTTLTGSGPCDGADAFLHPLAASNASRRPALRNVFFTNVLNSRIGHRVWEVLLRFSSGILAGAARRVD